MNGPRWFDVQPVLLSRRGGTRIFFRGTPPGGTRTFLGSRFHRALIEGFRALHVEGSAGRNEIDLGRASSARTGADFDAAGINSLFLRQVSLGVDCALLRGALAVLFIRLVVADDDSLGVGFTLQTQGNVVENGLCFVVHTRRLHLVLELDLVQLRGFGRRRRNFNRDRGGRACVEPAVVSNRAVDGDVAGRSARSVEGSASAAGSDAAAGRSEVVSQRTIIRAGTGCRNRGRLAGANCRRIRAAGDGGRMLRRLLDGKAGVASRRRA